MQPAPLPHRQPRALLPWQYFHLFSSRRVRRDEAFAAHSSRVVRGRRDGPAKYERRLPAKQRTEDLSRAPTQDPTSRETTKQTPHENRQLLALGQPKKQVGQPPQTL